jgi:hypothetical protein
MSQSSFPRPEHIAALRAHLQNFAKESGVELQAENSGLDRYHCHYRVGLRSLAGDWREELSVHFQVAERLLAGGNTEGLDRQLKEAVNRYQSFLADQS